MRFKRCFAILLSFFMILSLIPATAAEDNEGSITLPSTMSYTANLGTGTLGQDGYSTRPYALSWTLNGLAGQYRVGYIAFSSPSFSIEQNQKIISATLHLTISRTQNITGGTSTVTVYATDFNQIAVNDGKPGMPERSIMVGKIIMPEGIAYQDTNLSVPVSAELDLSEYFIYYPDSKGIGLYLTNREDIPEANSFGLVGFYGYDEQNAPTLTINIKQAASANLTYKAGSTVLGTKEIRNLTIGDAYTLTEEEAPKLITVGDKIYIRNNVNEKVTITPSGEENNYDIQYTEVTIESISADNVSMYYGGKAQLPKKAEVTFSDRQKLYFEVTWNQEQIKQAENKIGTSMVQGIIHEFPQKTVTCNVTVREFVKNESVVTNNGGWNWYVEPSGTHIQPGDKLATRFENEYASNNGYKFKHDRTYMGWVEDNGSVVVSQYDHKTGEHKRVVLHDRLEPDDHNNPAVIILPDGRIMAWYSMHTNEPYMYYRVSKNPEDISEWHEEQYYYCRTATGSEYSTYNATYPTAFVVNQNREKTGGKGEDRIYLFWRGVHWQPTIAQFSIPDENGKCKVIMGQTQIVNAAKSDSGKQSGSEGTLRPYAKYDYDFENGIIHMTYTYTHPDNAAQNPIFYTYINIEDQGIYTAKGVRLQDIPFENHDSYNEGGKNQKWGIVVWNLIGTYPELVVFDPKNEARRGWTWDIKANKDGEPCIVYADITDQPPGENESLPESFPDTSEDRVHHYYYYARWDKNEQKWVTTFLTYGGKWFHENTVQERCYSGGLSLDHNAEDANVVYLAKPTIGLYGNIFEIYRWESPDKGATWPADKQEPLTQNSKINNARPNVIYNYKQNEDGTHGPRVLWVRGEYRYWMNYEYKTGVMTDFSGITTQDDPEMKADAFLLNDSGNEINKLSAELAGKPLTARFKISNISVGDGRAMLAVAHYDRNNKLKGIKTSVVEVPARSVPQIPVLGAPKGRDEGTYSTMGTEEIVADINYLPSAIQDGDRLRLFAWNMGVNKMKSIISIPYEITTNGDRYLMKDPISYDGTEALKIGEGEEWNGWKASLTIENNNYVPSFGEKNYVAVTRAPFGNTALHLYHNTTSRTTGEEGGLGGVMISHALPEVDEDYVINFKIRWINELSWSYPSTAYSGFLLSHGTPIGHADNAQHPCAFQLRHIGQDGGTNGRRGRYIVYKEPNFNGGSEITAIEWVDGAIGNNSDKLMEGALFDVRIIVRPSKKVIECYINDGYRTGYYTQSYNGSDGRVDWDANKINNITFNTGIGSRGELYIDDFNVRLLDDESEPTVEPELSKISIRSANATQGNAANAVDGDASTYWQADSTNEDPTPELVAELDNTYTVGAVQIKIADIHSGKEIYCDVYLSEDGENWKRIWRGSSSSGSMYCTNGNLVKARYVKVRVNGNASDKSFSISEIDVFGF